MAYKFDMTGEEISERFNEMYEDNITQNNEINTLNTELDSLKKDGTTQINNLSTEINNLKNVSRHYCCVYYAGSGNVTVTGTHIIFNTVISNEDDCYSTDTGYYTVPEDGYYLISASIYSNGTSTGQRFRIMLSNGCAVMTNGPYGSCLSTIQYCSAGTTICCGGYETFGISIYAEQAHNEMSIIKV